MKYTLSAESISAAHPDKICDQISDAIVDACLRDDPQSRVAVDCIVTANQVIIFGEITSSVQVDYKKIARQVIKDLGYTNPDWGFSNQSPIQIKVHQQSPDIAQGVKTGGAGDQGIMVGYACQETPQLMPLPIMLAHQLVKNLDQARLKSKLPYLRPDGKAEVVINYDQEQATNVKTIVLACPHNPSIEKKQLEADLKKEIILPALDKVFPDRQKPLAEQIIINGTGKWTIGGPASDSGLTGRKIVIDNYGPSIPVGGGAFSGKDASKVDRSAAYAMRYIAKNIVAAGLATRCQTSVTYVIGQAKPLAFKIDTFGTEQKSSKLIYDFAQNLLDLTVNNIIEHLDLRQPIYQKTASYGHVGREGFSWEEILS